MVESTVFANRGAPVSVAAIDEDRIDEMSLGELLYAQALFAQRAAARLAEPDALQQVATFIRGAGADWAGFHADQTPDDKTTAEQAADPVTTVDAEDTADAVPEAPSAEPVAPENYVDTVPAMLDLLDRASRVTDAAFAHMVGLLEATHRNQQGYLGVPADARGFKDPIDVLRQRLRMSRQQAKHHATRAKYLAQTTTTAGVVPQLPQLAAAYTAGRVPTANVDKLITFDAAAAEHATKTGHTLEYKNAVLEAFEPTLVDAAETDTPEELSKAKQGWLELLAYHIDPDGPPPVLTSKKHPDNALHIRNHADGSATASMHMDPMWAAFVQEFLNTNLNYRGNTPLLPDNIDNLYAATAAAKAAQQAQHDRTTNSTTDTHDSASDDNTAPAGTEGSTPTADEIAETPVPDQGQAWSDEQSATSPADDRQASVADFHAAIGTDPDPARRLANQLEQTHPHPTGLDEVIAEDEHRNPVTRRQVEWIDTLTRAQRAGSIILGALYRIMSMPPDEAVKRAHGSPAKLVVVQDIQTAYHTLGLPPVPAAVQRPTGAAGILPPIPAPPDPDIPDDPATGVVGYANPVAWTPYQSAIVNVGPIHPGSIQPGLCDADLVGQIWNGDDVVLNEYRTKRLFTAAQRRAIFARTKAAKRRAAPSKPPIVNATTAPNGPPMA